MLLVAMLLCSPPPSLSTSAPEREPVVIHATFWPYESEVCVAPEINEERDGIGGWYVGAPCQQRRHVPLMPWCWKDYEDPCISYYNPLTLTAGGLCPDAPCKAEYVVDIQINEPCVGTCDYPKCCASGTLRVTDLTQVLGWINTGQTATFSSLSDCPCTELEDKTCTVMMQVQCQELGVYYSALATFGYSFTCKRCGP